ncbi:uncharacterized protein uacaa [Brachyhypopomus gauderio]|uniref:uncharacterized protein uacaa n=1 Tax=Brachyhypopomus gauderio TaxID=698409 RepID=UPI0040431887
MKSLKQRLKKQETSTSSTDWSKYDERLLKAVENGDVDKIAAILKKGATPTKLNTEGRSALHLAARDGLINSLYLLLSHGVNLHSPDTAGKTALHLSAGAGHSACVQRLLQCRSPVDSTDLQGRTALHDAAYAGHSIIIKMLCESGASVNSVDMDGYSPLLLAARRGHPRACQQLLHSGASGAFRDKHNKTALILACEHPCRDVVEVLLKNKADVTALDIHGYDSCHYARLSEDQALITMVRQAWEAACKAKESEKTAQKVHQQRSMNTEAQTPMRKSTAHAPARVPSSGTSWTGADEVKHEKGASHQSARERGGLSADGKEVERRPRLESAQSPHSASFRSALRPAEVLAGDAEPLRRELGEARRRQEAAQQEVLRLEAVLAKRIRDYEELRMGSELALQEAHGRAWELEEALWEVQRRMAGSEARVRQMQAHLVSVRENLVEEIRAQRHEARAHKEVAAAQLEEVRKELGQSRRELEEQRGQRDELLKQVHELTKDLRSRDEHTEAQKASLEEVQARRTEMACKEIQTSSAWQPVSPETTFTDLTNGTLQRDTDGKDHIGLEEHEEARSVLSTALRQAEACTMEALQKQRRAEEETRGLLAELQDQKAELDILQEALQARFVPVALLEEKERELDQLRLIIKEMETKQRNQTTEETGRQQEGPRQPDPAHCVRPEHVDNTDPQAGSSPQESMKPNSKTTEVSVCVDQERILAKPPDGPDKGLQDAVEAQGQRETQNRSSAPSCPCPVAHSDCAALQAHVSRLQQQIENSERHYRQVLSVYRARLLSAAQGYMDVEAREALLQIAQMRPGCVC